MLECLFIFDSEYGTQKGLGQCALWWDGEWSAAQHLCPFLLSPRWNRRTEKDHVFIVSERLDGTVVLSPKLFASKNREIKPDRWQKTTSFPTWSFFCILFYRLFNVDWFTEEFSAQLSVFILLGPSSTSDQIYWITLWNRFDCQLFWTGDCTDKLFEKYCSDYDMSHVKLLYVDLIYVGRVYYQLKLSRIKSSSSSMKRVFCINLFELHARQVKRLW